MMVGRQWVPILAHTSRRRSSKELMRSAACLIERCCALMPSDVTTHDGRGGTHEHEARVRDLDRFADDGCRAELSRRAGPDAGATCGDREAQSECRARSHAALARRCAWRAWHR